MTQDRKDSGPLGEAVAGERPLTARSVLASTLLGTDPPVLPTARLVRVAELFGVRDGAARVALSRMAAAGEVAADDGGWRLAGPLLERRERLAAGRRPSVRRWDGAWLLVVVVAGARPAADRTRLRATLTRRHLAEYRDGMWCRPDNLGDLDLDAPLADQVATWAARPSEPAVDLAARLWDLGRWAERAEELRRRLGLVRPALDSGDAAALAPGFVLSAAVLRHLAADPLLPPELLPAGWPGAALREEYEAWDERYRALLRAWHRRAGVAPGAG